MADTPAASSSGDDPGAGEVTPTAVMAAMVGQGGERAVAFDLGGVLLTGGVLSAGG